MSITMKALRDMKLAVLFTLVILRPGSLSSYTAFNIVNDRVASPALIVARRQRA